MKFTLNCIHLSSSEHSESRGVSDDI